MKTTISLANVAGLRKTGALSQSNLVRTERLIDGSSLPLIVRPNAGQMELGAWLASHKDWLAQLLLREGGILFRDFKIPGAEGFEHFVKTVFGDPLEYREQTSPRQKVQGNIYTSTEYPPQSRIFLHNENSYSSSWPMKIMFFCVTPAAEGGETPIADVRRVLARIPENIRARFADQGWMLARNFGTGYGLSWQTAFQTTDKAEVSRYCEASNIEWEWLSGDRLRIRQRRPAIMRHPHSGELLWFNHATFFHISTLDAHIRDGLLAELPEQDLPYNTYYGDGSRIEPEVLEILRDAYVTEQVSFTWREHDLLLLDNMLVAHGRSSFRGQRKILVGMAEPYSSPDRIGSE